jgi:hypothetical protein
MLAILGVADLGQRGSSRRLGRLGQAFKTFATL